MPQTWGDAKFEVLVRLKRSAVGTNVTRPKVDVAMNIKLKELYQTAVMADPEFFTKMQSFSGTTITLNTDYRQTWLIECTDANCASGFAEPFTNREWILKHNNSERPPTNADPIYKLNATTIDVSPSRTGTHYYIKTIGDVTDDATPLIDLLPWPFHNSLILGTCADIAQHTTNKIDNPTAAQRSLQFAQMAEQSLKSFVKPLNLFQMELPTPPAVTS